LWSLAPIWHCKRRWKMYSISAMIYIMEQEDQRSPYD
jgi:hypothetical protein